MIEHLESGLAAIARLLKLSLEAISVLCILLGLVATVRLLIPRRGQTTLVDLRAIRLSFGAWLASALEFQLGADILSTTISPTFQALGQLGAIALIRTFLNYFLNKELETEAKIQAKLKEINSKHSSS
jgi:uncharacterized membrane protein